MRQPDLEEVMELKKMYEHGMMMAVGLFYRGDQVKLRISLAGKVNW